MPHVSSIVGLLPLFTESTARVAKQKGTPNDRIMRLVGCPNRQVWYVSVTKWLAEKFVTLSPYGNCCGCRSTVPCGTHLLVHCSILQMYMKRLTTISRTLAGRNRISADQNCFVPADREVSYITTMWVSTFDCHEALSLSAIESLFC